MVRTTISIPDDLKTLMDEGGETVNWSAVAADADSAEVVDSKMVSHVELLKGNGGPLQERPK